MCGDAQMGQAELHAMEKNATLQRFEEDMTNLALQERDQPPSVASSHLSDMLPGLDLGLDVAEHPSQQAPTHARSDVLLCVVCMEREKKVVLLPCKHICMCKGCTDEIVADSAQCPVCREHIVDSFEAFI